MNAFAGGLFLAMALVDILPEAAKEYTEAMLTQETSLVVDSHMDMQTPMAGHNHTMMEPEKPDHSAEAAVDTS